MPKLDRQMLLLSLESSQRFCEKGEGGGGEKESTSKICN